MSTLAPYAHAYVVERRHRGEITAGTAGDLRYRLSKLADSFGDRPTEQFDEQAVLRWLGTIGHMRPASRRAYLISARGFCRWMVRRGHLAADPTIDIDRIREPRRVARPLTTSQIGTLMRSRPGLRDQAMLWTMLGDGLRVSEVGRALVDDYDPVGATLFVRGKGSNERMVPVPAPTAAALHRYLDDVGWLPGPLVRPINGTMGHLRGKWISDLVTRWMYECGIKRRARDGVSPHALRHTCASDVFALCRDITVVQKLLGHANPATTSNYVAGADVDAIRSALDRRRYFDDEAA